MDYRNYTDNLIDEYFKNNNIEDEDFLTNLEDTIKKSQITISDEFDKLLKENEHNSKTVNETKDMYFEKLELITNLYNNFEFRVDHLNKHYSDKLSYISVLSGNLGEFEKFKTNIVFANKIFDYINLLNSSEDINKIIPDIFTQPEKMLEDGVEIFEAFRQLVDVTGRDFPIFTKNFKVIETKMKECIQISIKDFYENNELNKLEKLMKVTEVLHSDFIIEMYVNYIITSVDFVFIIKSMKDIMFDKMSKELETNIFNMTDEFYNKIINVCQTQYGHAASKIYLIFPESRHKIVISHLVMQLSNLIKQFREILIKEQGKSDSIYVRIVEYIYPQSLQFVERFKETFSFCKTDLWNNIEQDTAHFLRKVEAAFMSKDKNLVREFILYNYESKQKLMEEIKRFYDSKQSSIDQFQNDLLDLITSTNFSVIAKFSMENIIRYQNLIRNKNEQLDMTASFCKDILDSLQKLLQSYCNLVAYIMEKRTHNNHPLSPTHYLFLSKITFLHGEFQHIFLYDLKDFFKQMKFFDDVEDDIKRRVCKIEFNIDKFYSQLASYTSSSLHQNFKNFKPKETYNVSKQSDEYSCSIEMETICNFLRPLFTTVVENWPEVYKKKICQLITQITVEKLIDVLKNAKISEVGVNFLTNDFLLVFKTFAERLEPQFFNKINELRFLVEIFTHKKEDVDIFVSEINVGENNKSVYDPELLKILVKKRKALKK